MIFNSNVKSVVLYGAATWRITKATVTKGQTISAISIITQVIIEILALSLAENGSAIITSAEVIIAGAQIFKTAASRFVNVSEEKINLMKENAIPKFGMTLFKGKM